MSVPEPTPEHVKTARALTRRARTGWYTGDEESILRYGGRAVVPSAVNPQELRTSLLFSRDKMHHSVGWWRNAEYEYCWHLSIGVWEASAFRAYKFGLRSTPPPWEDLPDDEVAYWARLLFGEHANKAWHEPGGTDPRLTRAEAHGRASMVHLRVFLDPETFEPFIPSGEVYTLTRWLPGVTPDKVDR